jgi:hypothetical protein
MLPTTGNIKIYELLDVSDILHKALVVTDDRNISYG